MALRIYTPILSKVKVFVGELKSVAEPEKPQRAGITHEARQPSSGIIK